MAIKLQQFIITALDDYEPIVGTRVVFQPEDTKHSVHIGVIGDDVLENDEQFLLELAFPEDQHFCRNQIPAGDVATITILNDDSM